jgi:hypothetical protein
MDFDDYYLLRQLGYRKIANLLWREIKLEGFYKRLKGYLTGELYRCTKDWDPPYCLTWSNETEGYIILKNNHQIDIVIKKEYEIKNETDTIKFKDLSWVGIYLVSDGICLKKDKEKSKIFDKVRYRHWWADSNYFEEFKKETEYHHFTGYTGLLNFFNKIVDMVYAIYKWDKKMGLVAPKTKEIKSEA